MWDPSCAVLCCAASWFHLIVSSLQSCCLLKCQGERNRVREDRCSDVTSPLPALSIQHPVSPSWGGEGTPPAPASGIRLYFSSTRATDNLWQLDSWYCHYCQHRKLRFWGFKDLNILNYKTKENLWSMLTWYRAAISSSWLPSQWVSL